MRNSLFTSFKMAEGAKRRSLSRISAKSIQNFGISGSPSSVSKLFASKSVVRIPLQRIRCGKWDVKHDEKWLEYVPTSKTFRFGFHEHKDEDHDLSASFECTDITAADLRVGTKFGCFDSMIGTLTVECGTFIAIDTFRRKSNTNRTSVYVAELTFHVNHTGQVRDVLRALRYAKLEEAVGDNNNGQKAERTEKTMKLREGLPEWVHWIPHRLYTPSFRQIIELIILIYTLLSILWALWQLYRHVDFMRAYMQPVLDLLRYHIHLLDKLMHIMNEVFESFTERWFSYLKPGYVLLTSLVAPLFSAISPLWLSFCNAASILKIIIGPAFDVLHSLLYYLYVFFVKVPCTVLQPLYHLFIKLWSLAVDITIHRMFPTQFASLRKVLVGFRDLMERSVNLDPLRSHFLLMRTTVINSSKALGLGLVAMYRRTEYLIWKPEEVEEIVEEEELDESEILDESTQ